MERVHEEGTDSLLKAIGELGNYYVSLDIDALDPSLAPGTESPEADGLSFRQARQLLRGPCQQRDVSRYRHRGGKSLRGSRRANTTHRFQLLLEGIAAGFITSSM